MSFVVTKDGAPERGHHPNAKYPGRRWFVLLATVVLLLAGTATVRVATDDGAGDAVTGPDGKNADDGGTAGDRDLRPDGETRSLNGQTGPGTSSPPSRERGSVGEGAAGARAATLFVVGDITNSRLVATTSGIVLDGMQRLPPAAQLAITGVSPVIGAPLSVVAVGPHLVVGSTDHAQLVRIDHALADVKVLSVKDRIKASGVLSFGSFIVLGPRSVLVSVAYDSSVALVELDTAAWAVGRVVTFADRFAGFPRICAAKDVVFLLTTGTVDVLDRASLQRRASVSVSESSTGMTCARERAWVATSRQAELTEVTTEGVRGGQATWNGKGSTRLAYDDESDRVFGTDQAAGLVFACSPRLKTCDTSASIGKKPTDLAFVAGHLVVTIEGSQSLGVLDPVSLAFLGSVSFPGLPRTITVVRP